MKEKLSDRARRTVLAIGRGIGYAVEKGTPHALGEARKNILQQRSAIADEIEEEVAQVEGVVDALVVRPLRREAEIFNRIDPGEVLLSGIIGGLLGLAREILRENPELRRTSRK